MYPIFGKIIHVTESIGDILELIMILRYSKNTPDFEIRITKGSW